ncbi:acyltransferase domain-containing protein [Luteibacter sp.]|uniref:acyltransferase domain-containing protein n=1 Tax=Luteibacter sp. TaxID=1886636 RepID=UPI0025BC6D2D|nr:acyltransferase domain-containing protein [Luteibacter sp.]
MNDDENDITFVFAGQGSQHGMMAYALYGANRVFRETLRELDTMMIDLTGQSVISAMYDPPARAAAPWDDLSTTHPAIFMVEYAVARAVMAEGILPSRVLGTSLGAFAAAVVAGAMSVETGLEATIQQAAAIEACCPPGGMVAVLARADEWIPRLAEMGEVAALNFDTHFVMAAPDEGLREIEACLVAGRVGFQHLPVRHAFHSRWIDPAADVFLAYCSTMELSVPRIPILCCERAAPLPRVDTAHFWRVVRQPIRLAETVEGVGGRSLYLDMEPSGTLATFLRYILPEPRRVKAVLSRLGRDEVELGRLRTPSGC